MIEIFEGRLGGGKTFYAVERMMKYMGSGGHVSTNIRLNMPGVIAYVRKKYLWDIQPGQYIFLEDEQIPMFHRYTPAGSMENPSLVVVDEAHIWLNARDWGQQSRELLSFLTQSRKCFTDIIFISQSALNVDKQIMRLVQYIWRFRDMQKFKIAGLGLTWPIPQFLRVQFDYDGSTVLDKVFVIKDKTIYSLYYSYELVRKFPRLAAQAVKFDGKIKSKRGFWMRMIIIIICVALGMGIWMYKKFSSGQLLTAGKKEQVVNGPGSQAVAAPGNPSIPLIIKDHFRGIIEDERGRVIIGDTETYIAGGLCSIGKVVSCKEDMVVVAGFDGRPHLIQRKPFTSDELSWGLPASPVGSESVAASKSSTPPLPAGIGGIFGGLMPPAASVSSGHGEAGAVKSFDVMGGVVSAR